MSAAIREIRRIYPDAYIVLAIHKRVADLAEHCPYVDEIVINDLKIKHYNLDEIYYGCMQFSQSTLLKYRFDIAYAFAYGAGPFTALLTYMSGAKERISHATASIELFFPLLTFIAPFPLYGTHTADIAMSYLDWQLRAPVPNRQLEVWVAESDLKEISQLLPQSDNMYAICVGGSHPRKHWSPKFYAELINMILRSEEAHFVILGGPQDVEESAVIESLVEADKIVNLTGKINYRLSTATLSFCKAYIGNDTGLMHAATAVGIPVLTPFCFAADIKLPPKFDIISIPKRWYPYGVPSVVVQPKHALPECKNAQNVYGCKSELNKAHCINQITPKTMFKAFKLLKEQVSKKSTKPLYFC